MLGLVDVEVDGGVEDCEEMWDLRDETNPARPDQGILSCQDALLDLVEVWDPSNTVTDNKNWKGTN